MTKTRGLSDRFMKDLQSGGSLNQLLLRVQGDTTLDLEIRENYLNVYYRGGSLLKVSPVPRKPGAYTFFFDKNYAPKPRRAALGLPADLVESPAAVEKWMAAIPVLKDTMDLWFGKHPKDERALQQTVVWENNDSPWANGTDYFIIDIEYDNHRGARFDLVALEWESSASPRKLAKGYQPRLVIIEMKAGDGALKGEAGIETHIEQQRRFLGNKRRVEAFKNEMLNVFEQKRDLGLIKALKRNPNHIKKLAANVDVVFLLAGHDPASRKLSTILTQVQQNRLAAPGGASIQFCSANFMGYGLYKEGVHLLSDFSQIFSEQLKF
ncbi:MAG: hypothetical protein HN919_07660 [Verrucomicrobia bacterium]|jgi:hypothetical protein|nr:hypothetical protein [Verrucomicrobiota bacterium]